LAKTVVRFQLELSPPSFAVGSASIFLKSLRPLHRERELAALREKHAAHEAAALDWHAKAGEAAVAAACAAERIAHLEAALDERGEALKLQARVCLSRWVCGSRWPPSDCAPLCACYSIARDKPTGLLAGSCGHTIVGLYLPLPLCSLVQAAAAASARAQLDATAAKLCAVRPSAYARPCLKA
jgi:hypothetical protein